MARIDRVRENYENVTDRLFSDNAAFAEYLKFAGKFFKLPSAQSMTVYGVKPDAAMVAEYDTWTRFDRHVKRGTSSIAVLENGSLKHLFDISQTNGSKIPYQWTLDKDTANALIEETFQREGQRFNSFSGVINYYGSAKVRENLDNVINSLNIPKASRKAFEKSYISMTQHLIAARCELGGKFTYSGTLDLSALDMLHSKAEKEKLCEFVHLSGKSVLMSIERSINNILMQERTVDYGRNKADMVRGGQEVLSRNQNGERQDVQARSENIRVSGANGTRSDGRGTGSDERGHRALRNEVERVYDGEPPRSDTVAGGTAEMGTDTQTDRQRGSGVSGAAAETVREREPSPENVHGDRGLGENARNDDRQGDNGGHSSSVQRVTDNEVDTYINPDTQKAEESVSPAFSIDDIKLIVNNISRISDNLNENYNGEYQEYTLANYAFSHSGAEYDLNLSVRDNVNNMLANGEYGFLTEYLQTIYNEAFAERILLDEGVIAENTLPLIEEHTKKSERSLNIPADLDKFYINKESESVTWVYFNPDSSAGGQLVYNNITFDQLLDALESDNISETLTHTARTVLVDVDDPVFQSRAKYFLADNEDFSFNGEWDKEKLSAIVEPTYSTISAVEIFKAKTAEKFSPVDGQTAHDIEDTVRDFVQGVLNDGGIDAEIVDLAVTGSRSRGLESDGSDIDVVVEFSSELKEDALFNILHEQAFDVGGIAIDINPIRKEETGTLGEYLENAEKTIAENHERKAAAVPSADNIDRISEIISEVRHGKTAQIIENAEKDVIIEDARKRKFSNIRLGYNNDSGFNLTADTDRQKDVIITVFGRNEQAVRDYLTKNAKEIDIVEEKSTIHFGYLGNGLTVYDVSKWDNEIKDYPTIAHITNEGIVNYRAEKSTLAPSDIARIEAQALQLKQEFTESWNKLSYEQRLQRVLDGADALAKPDWDVFFADKTALTGEEIVKKYEHAIIFKDEQFPTAEKSLTAYRVGDFYELFNEDAHVSSDLLGLTQTTRQGKPMTGFPQHTFEKNRRQLAMLGYYLKIGDEREIDKVLNANAAPDKFPAKSPNELRVGDLVRGDGAIWRITDINGDFSINFENIDKTANNSVSSIWGHWKERFAEKNYSFVSPAELTAEQLREINAPSAKPKPKKPQAETVQQDSEQLSLFDEPTREADIPLENYIGGVDIEEAFKRELIQHGTGFVDGKFGVEEFYLEHKGDTKAFAKYLSDAYGIGGRSGEGKILSVDHNLFGVKGISMRIALDNGEETRVSWNWNKVAKRIARLIEDGEYITQDEIDKRIKRYQREYSLGAESPYYEKANNVLDHYGLLPEQTKTETLTVTDAQELEKGDKIRYEGKEWTVGMVGDYLISLNSSSGEHKNIYNALEKKWYDELNERGFEFITAADEPVISENTAAELNRAKELINDFCDNEYDGEVADFSDLSRVAIAYTEDEETGMPINVYADLVRNRIITQFNNVTVRVDQYTSLAEMNEVALPELNFDELILDAITYKQPTITCNFSENRVFTADKTYTVAEFDEIMKQADDRRVAGKKAAIKFYGSERAWSEAERKRVSSSDQFAEYLGYDKTSFTVNMPGGSSFTERQDIGSGYGGVIDFLSKVEKYKDIVPLLEKARYEQNADRVAALNGNYDWETFSEKDFNELTAAIKAHDTENRRDSYSISSRTENTSNFLLEVGVSTSSGEWALHYALYDEEVGDFAQIWHYNESEIPDYFTFVKTVESEVQKKITETIDARAVEISRPTKQERTEDNFSVIQEFTFDNEKSRAATKDFALSTGATVSEIPEKALKSGLYGIKVETWESRADEIKDFAAAQNAVNTHEWGVHQVVTVNDMSGADYKYDYRSLAEAIEAADGYASGTRQEMYGEFVKYDGAVVYNKDNLKIEHKVGDFDVRSIFSEELLKANGIDVPDRKTETTVEEKPFETENIQQEQSNEIKAGDSFMYRGNIVTVTDDNGIYPDDIVITREEKVGGVAVAVTENVNAAQFAREAKRITPEVNKSEQTEELPIEIKNLAQLKRALTVGTEFEITSYIRDDVVNQLRRVNDADTTAIYSIRPDVPDDNSTTLANNGRGSYLPWEKASDWEFVNGSCTAYRRGMEHTEENKLFSIKVRPRVLKQERGAENRQTAEITNPLIKELAKTFPADTAEQLYNAFEGAKMADWDSNQAKINRVKRSLYNILGNEEQTESAFAVLANGGTAQRSTDNILDKLDAVKDSDGYADLKADVEILLRDKNGDSIVGISSDVWLKKLNEMSANELREYANHYEKGQLNAYGSLNFDEKLNKIAQTANTKIDYTITDEHLGEGGAKTKFAANIAAIQTLKQIESENRFATPEEQETLSRYVGWGGLPQAFDPNNESWTKEYHQLKELMTEREYRAANASVLNAHYTSPTVIQAIYKGLQHLGFKGGNILEPAMGVGNFFGAMPDDMRKNSNLSGVELDSISGRIAKQLYPTADIQVKGFEETDFSDNYFDVAVGNVPFGSVPISDKRYNRENFFIHDYFLAKSLDKIAPNGIMAMITTKGTLDKTSPKVREYLAKRADLIGAIRLPNNAFKANAGTEVTTDILFFQKREKMAVEMPDWCYTGTTPDGVPVNNYFVDHPEMILGTMKQGMEYSLYGNANETACVPIEGANLAEQLEKAVTNLKVNRALQIHTEERAKREGVIPATADVRNFTFAEVDGLMYYRENNIMTAVVDKDNKPISGKKLERLKALNELRKTFRTILTAQENDCSDVQLREYQKILNNQYDVFVKKYGYINDSANLQVFGKDDDYNSLCALEVIDEETKKVEKSDFFSKRTVKHFAEIDHVDTPQEAMHVSIDMHGRLDFEYMARLCGKEPQEVVDELIADNLIYLNPNKASTEKPYEGWEETSEYLSGNVRIKLRAAELAVKDNPAYQRNVVALTAVIPKRIEAGDIAARIGVHWVDVKDYQRFLEETAQARFAEPLRRAINGEYKIGRKGSDRSAAATQIHGTGRMNSLEIFENLLNNRDVVVKDKKIDPETLKEYYVINKKETELAQDKASKMKAAFTRWLWSDPDRREKYVTRYNELFNSLVGRKFDGSHQTFPGMSPYIKLKPHQLDAVARAKFGGNTLLAHCVGAGKSFEMVAATMEKKRLGLINKACVVVPKSLVGQMSAEWLRLYPQARILTASENDFSKDRRQKFIGRCCTGEYDAVIMSYEQFEKIGMSFEYRRDFIQREIDGLTKGINDLESDYRRAREDRGTIKDMERIKKRLETKLKKLIEDNGKVKDTSLDFEQLGFDSIVVDEAHNYKNGLVVTKMSRVAGVQTTPAQKSEDILMKTQYLNENYGEKNLIFATGTPVSNSMTELYIMTRYLRPSLLWQAGLQTFDDWASTFGEVVSKAELKPAGDGYRTKKRFAKFNNLPELMSMYKEFADVRTADMLNLPVPEIEGGKPQTLVAHPNDFQKAYMKELAIRSEAVHNGAVEPNVDNMLKITGEARLLGLDARCLNPDAENYPDSKVNMCIDKVVEIYTNTKAQKGVQAIFCDIAVQGDNEQEEQEEESKGKGKSKNKKPKIKQEDEGKFSVYNYIKAELIRRGIPRDEICFAGDANNQKQQNEMRAQLRAGTKRIVIASTSKLGTGANIQNKLVALHNLDIPWKPSDLEQRLGRIIRQGNENGVVGVYNYVTTDTFDAYMMNIIVTKQKFISQLMNGESSARSCEDVDDMVLNYTEMQALATGDPRIKEKIELDTDVARLKMLENEHYNEQYRLDDVIKDAEINIKNLDHSIAAAKSDVEFAALHPITTETFSIEIKGKTYTERKAAGEALRQAAVEFMANSNGTIHQPIGTFRGFELAVERGHNAFGGTQTEIAVRHGITYTTDMDIKGDIGNITRLENLVNDGIGRKLANLENRLETAKKDLQAATENKGKPFEHAEELETKTKRLDQLNLELEVGKTDEVIMNDDEDEEHGNPEHDAPDNDRGRPKPPPHGKR